MPQCFSIFPEAIESANNRGLVDGPKKMPQALAFRTAIHRVGRVFNVEVQLLCKKPSERPIGKIENIPAVHLEQIFKKHYVDGANVGQDVYKRQDDCAA